MYQQATECWPTWKTICTIKDRLDKEWKALCGYRADNVSIQVAEENTARNRSSYAVPYDHSCVKLSKQDAAPMESDYINASLVIDNDPRWPVHTAAFVLWFYMRSS